MVNIFDYGTRFTLIFTFEFHIKSMTDIYYYKGNYFTETVSRFTKDDLQSH